jgi:hypothetical protein
MLSDLGQPSTDIYQAYNAAFAATASSAVLARIHTIRGM